MPIWAWVTGAALLAAVITIAVFARRAHLGRLEAVREIARIEADQERILQGLILAQDASSRILMPGELTEMATRIARETGQVLGMEGTCVLMHPPGGAEEPTGHCWGRIPDGMADAERPVEEVAVQGFGSPLSIPIRMGETLLGEFRLAESPGRLLNAREVQVARLLAQVVAIAAQYRSQQNALERAEEDKRRFILATTHDLRAPVATIGQLVQVLREGYAEELGAKQRELLDKVHGRVDQLLDLLSDLLNLAADDQSLGRMRRTVPVSLSAVFDAQVEAARTACETRAIELTSRRPDGPLMRMAAEGDLEKILSNLLSNAVKYTRPGGQINASLEDSASGVLFRVKDTGIGIPEGALRNLFTEYFRAPNAKEMERHGTGLGLALVQKLVRKYGGRIRVDSVEGKGTMFEVLLPPE